MAIPLTESPQIYYQQEHALYYIFDRAGELDIPMTRNVQMRNWTLYYTASHYYIRSPEGDFMIYDICSANRFNDWYERQPHLGVFIMANGIPSYCCTAILPSAPPSAPPAYTELSSAPLPRPKTIKRPKPTKPHLVSLVLKAAVAEHRVCPITFDPITESSRCIAPCYHSFDPDAINNWLETNTTCPECRETCME
jgi:hypothetical protein